MFYIIGISHRAHLKDRFAPETETQREYRACIERALAEIKPALVAEELSEYALAKRSKEKGAEQESLTKLIADAAQIEHRFCDPDDAAREKMGYEEGSYLAFRLAMEDGSLSNAEINRRGYAIEAGKYWPRREKYWLEQLGDVKDKNVIFVCGDAHVEGFQKLLKKNGIESSVVRRHIGVDQRDDEQWAGVLAYLGEHPELVDS
jgi:hypothetical protein